MAGLEDRTGRIERAVQRVEEANGKTEAKLEELMDGLRALRMSAPPPRALAPRPSAASSWQRPADSREEGVHKIIIQLPDFVSDGHAARWISDQSEAM